LFIVASGTGWSVEEAWFVDGGGHDEDLTIAPNSFTLDIWG